MTQRASTIFLREYLRDPLTIGSIMADSGQCVNTLLKNVPFDTARVVLEFGSGSGAVTKELVERKTKETFLITFEKNPHFYQALKKNTIGPNVILSGGDVLRAGRFLHFHGIQKGEVDCIVSTLPCSNMDYSTILQESVIPLLKPGGLFVQYMHVLSYLKGFSVASILKKYFSHIEVEFVPFNIPPAIVYHCRRCNDSEAINNYPKTFF